MYWKYHILQDYSIYTLKYSIDYLSSIELDKLTTFITGNYAFNEVDSFSFSSKSKRMLWLIDFPNLITFTTGSNSFNKMKDQIIFPGKVLL